MHMPGNEPQSSKGFARSPHQSGADHKSQRKAFNNRQSPNGWEAKAKFRSDAGASPQHGKDTRNKLINRQVTRAAETGDLNSLFKVIQENIRDMNGINLATALHRVAKLAGNPNVKLHEVKNNSGFAVLLDEIWRRLSGAACLYSSYNAPDWPMQCLSIVAWSCATLRIRNEALLAQVSAMVTPRLNELKPFELSNLVWAYAKLHLLDTELFKSVTDRILSRYDGEFKVQCLSTIAWCFATTQFRNAALFASIAEELAAHVEDLKPQEISTTLWAFAKNRHSCSRLFEVLGRAALRDSKILHFKLQELSNTAWAFATAGQRNVALFAQIEDAVLSKMSGIEPQSIANILWAFAKLEVPLQTDVFASLLRLTMSKQQEFKPEELSAVIWAASQTCPGFVAFFDAAMSTCVHRLSKFSMNAVAHLVKNLSAVQTNSPQLYVTLLKQSLEHLPQLRPASLCCVLQGSATAAAGHVYTAKKEVIIDAVSRTCDEIMARIHEFKKTEIQLVSTVLYDPLMGSIMHRRDVLEQVLQQRENQLLACAIELDEACVGSIAIEHLECRDGGEDEDSGYLPPRKTSSSGSDTVDSLPASPALTFSKAKHIGPCVQPEAFRASQKMPTTAPVFLSEALSTWNFPDTDAGAKVSWGYDQTPWKIPTYSTDEPWKVPLPLDMQNASFWMSANPFVIPSLHAGFVINANSYDTSGNGVGQSPFPPPVPVGRVVGPPGL